MEKEIVSWKGKRVCAALSCRSACMRCFGLMLRKRQSALLTLPVSARMLASVHTLFMRFAIDIFWLDEKGKVVDARLDAKPFRFNFSPCERAKYILEIPAGEAKLRIGDILAFHKV